MPDKQAAPTAPDCLSDLLDDLDDGPRKSLDDLWREGAITAKQYRSLLWLMQSGTVAYSRPEDAILGIDRKIAE